MYSVLILMLSVFVIGKDINGSKSWIPLGGGFNLQPAELCKIFAALALAKYLVAVKYGFYKTAIADYCWRNCYIAGA